MSAELTIAIAQTNPTVGDIPGNVARIRAARARCRGGGRRPRGLFRARGGRLPAGRPGAQAGLPGASQACGRGARRRYRGWRAGTDRRRALGRSRQALQRHAAAPGRAHRHRALQARPAELRRVRREAGVRCGTGARPDGVPAAGRRAAAHRRHGMRGHVDRRRGRGPRRIRSRDPDRAERLAVRARQAGRAPQSRGRARHRDRAAADLL